MELTSERDDWIDSLSTWERSAYAAGYEDALEDMNQILSVRHGFCSICGEEKDIFMLVLRANDAPSIVKTPENVHNGFCKTCIGDIGLLAIRFFMTERPSFPFYF